MVKPPPAAAAPPPGFGAPPAAAANFQEGPIGLGGRMAGGRTHPHACRMYSLYMLAGQYVLCRTQGCLQDMHLLAGPEFHCNSDVPARRFLLCQLCSCNAEV
jgi:hypothetical protein